MLIDFKEIDGLNLPSDRKLKLVDGVLLLERQNDELLSSGELGYVFYQLYFEDTEDIVYSDSMDLPIESFNFVSEIEQSLTADGEELTPEMEDFLTVIYKDLKQKRDRKKRKRIPKKIEPDVEKSTNNISVEPEAEPVLNIEPQTEEVLKNVEKHPQITPVEEKKKTFHFFGRSIKFPVIVAAVIFLLVILGVGAVNWIPKLFADRVPTFEELIKEEKYFDAARSYPEEKEEIEQHLYDQAVDKQTTENAQKLESYQKKYPTRFGAFDLAILNKNYEEALALYEKKPDSFKNSKDRMTLVGYCYLKKDKPKEAKKISIEIQSVELEKYVYKYEQLIAQIEEYDKQLEDLKKDPVKNRDKIEETLNDLFDSKEELVNL